MTQQTPEKQIEQLQQLVGQLKIRAFDADDQAKSLDQTLQQYGGAVAQLLGLEGDDAANLQKHIDALRALVTPTAEALPEVSTTEPVTTATNDA